MPVKVGKSCRNTPYCADHLQFIRYGQLLNSNINFLITNRPTVDRSNGCKYMETTKEITSVWQGSIATVSHVAEQILDKALLMPVMLNQYVAPTAAELAAELRKARQEVREQINAN